MTEPTEEQLRTEAYWRSTIARELCARADKIERDAFSRTAGIALASILRDAGDKVGQMPDRTDDATRVLTGIAPAYHVTRGTGPSDLEAGCPCPKEPCGGVDTARAHPDCDQHPARHSKTMRNIHRADRCPGGA